MENNSLKLRFIELRAQGLSFDKIAKELGKAKQTLIDWNVELQDEIANLKAMELEALYSSYYLTKENRLQGLANMLTKIKTEIERRDLSDVPTEKLLDLFIKYSNQAKDEAIEPTYKSSGAIHNDKIIRSWVN